MRNERDELDNAIEEFKAALLETQPFKGIYAAALWTLNMLAAALEKIAGGKQK